MKLLSSIFIYFAIIYIQIIIYLFIQSFILMTIIISIIIIIKFSISFKYSNLSNSTISVIKINPRYLNIYKFFSLNYKIAPIIDLYYLSISVNLIFEKITRLLRYNIILLISFIFYYLKTNLIFWYKFQIITY